MKKLPKRYQKDPNERIDGDGGEVILILVLVGLVILLINI